MNYPKRGEISEDGKLYTHMDGTVGERVEFTTCRVCAFNAQRQTVGCYGIPCGSDLFKLIEGAYVPSADEQAACDMARAHIPICGSCEDVDDCRECMMLEDRTCHLRKYLAAHGHADTAWEVAT